MAFAAELVVADEEADVEVDLVDVVVALAAVEVGCVVLVVFDVLVALLAEDEVVLLLPQVPALLALGFLRSPLVPSCRAATLTAMPCRGRLLLRMTPAASLSRARTNSREISPFVRAP